MEINSLSLNDYLAVAAGSSVVRFKQVGAAGAITRQAGKAEGFAQPEVKPSAPSNDNAFLRPVKKITFGDLQPPQLTINSYDFAMLQENNGKYVPTSEESACGGMKEAIGNYTNASLLGFEAVLDIMA